jgi:DNA polymerase-1
MSKYKVALVDGDFMFHRHLNSPGSKDLCTSDGRPSGIVYGAFTTLNTLINDADYDSVFVASSGGDCLWRQAIYPKYKYKDPADNKWEVLNPGEKWTRAQIFFPQRFYVVENLKHFGIRALNYLGYEADDCLMRLALYLADYPDQYEVTIISDDYDFCQCIRSNVSVYRVMANKLVTENNLYDYIGFNVNDYPYFKAIEGDGADNIPGVAKGMGPVSTKKLFAKVRQQFQEVNPNTIYNYLNDTQGTTAAEKLLYQQWDQFLINLRISNPVNLLEPEHDVFFDYVRGTLSNNVFFNHIEVSRVIKDYELKSLNYRILTNPKFQRLK